jgi:hypothetical protein
MENLYSLIADKNELVKFIEWLPDSSDEKQYYICLLARRKYLPDHPALKSDKTMISRWTSTKERLINKIEQKETKVGTYLGHNDIPVPQEALGCYITPSPRDFNQVAYKTIQTFAEKLGKSEYINPRQEVMNIIQTCPIRDKFHVFDIDSTDEDQMFRLRDMLDGHCNIIRTRGGYHFIINPSELKDQNVPKDWYNRMKAVADFSGDALVPIPGTFQGGFIPRLIHVSPLKKAQMSLSTVKRFDHILEIKTGES